MSGPTREGLTPAERDALYRACALAIDAAGPERDRLFLARLALLLMEALGDAGRCREALAAASLVLEEDARGTQTEAAASGASPPAGASDPR
jgi:hypothetical protein